MRISIHTVRSCLKNLATEISEKTDKTSVISVIPVAKFLDGLSPSFNITRRAGTDGQLTAASQLQIVAALNKD
jgi:hypothetical protein